MSCTTRKSPASFEARPLVNRVDDRTAISIHIEIAAAHSTHAAHSTATATA